MDTGTAIAFAMVALGSALGAMTRYAIARIVDSSTFPFATFVANIIACTLASFIVFRFAGQMDETARCLIVVGFFGGLSTLSTFTTDCVRMLFNDAYLYFAVNVSLNVGVCILGAMAGKWIADII